MKEQPNLKKTLFLAPLIADVLTDNKLRLPERAILSLLLQLSIKNGYCFANNKYFAYAFNCSLSTVSKSIKKLRQLGYIIKSEPDLDYGGRSYRRYLKRELYYNPESHVNKSGLVNNTKHPNNKKKHSIKSNNELVNIYMTKEEERDLVQNKLESSFRKWAFYCTLKNIYNKIYPIEWNRESILNLIRLYNRISRYFETKFGKITSDHYKQLLDFFKLIISSKPKFFQDCLPITFLKYFDKVTAQSDFLPSVKRNVSSADVSAFL